MYLVPLLAAVSTFALYRRFQGNIVRIATGVTLVFCLLVTVFMSVHSLAFDSLLTLFYAGTFVGMSTRKHFSYLDISIASLILAGIYALMYREIDQLGGALGFMSFCSVLVSMAVRKAHSVMQAAMVNQK
ncbi:hypothetical protein [Alteromonas sp. a30]|uniref:hypothetical protein n=1 Tax=Alteromonas sp. a30 TaxID=2730917 RepID=UPI00227EE071|nr:hypothetical protein [Alteromonas sp. a30]MCY7294238.1 hypothetical protein [Alteromonas sp. a30]